MRRVRQYSLQLPQELEKGKLYPLLIWNDALPETLAALLSDMFVLSVVSEERTADFSPWPQPAFRADAPPFGGGADGYHRELFEEKLPELIAKYPIDAGRIAYGGYSLGGLAAVYSIFRETAACAVFSLCGSFWYPGFADYCARTEIRNTNCRLYLQNGRREGEGPPAPLSRAADAAVRVADILRKKGVKLRSSMDDYGHHDGKEARFRELGEQIHSALCESNVS